MEKRRKILFIDFKKKVKFITICDIYLNSQCYGILNVIIFYKSLKKTILFRKIILIFLNLRRIALRQLYEMD